MRCQGMRGAKRCNLDLFSSVTSVPLCFQTLSTIGFTTQRHRDHRGVSSAYRVQEFKGCEGSKEAVSCLLCPASWGRAFKFHNWRAACNVVDRSAETPMLKLERPTPMLLSKSKGAKGAKKSKNAKGAILADAGGDCDLGRYSSVAHGARGSRRLKGATVTKLDVDKLSARCGSLFADRSRENCSQLTMIVTHAVITDIYRFDHFPVTSFPQSFRGMLLT